MKRFAKVIVSFIVVMAMMCSMVGVLAYGTNTVNGSTLKVEVIDTDGTTVVGTWTDPATSAVSNPIYVTAAQMIRITASLKDGGDVTVFSYASGTEESALDNDTIQYVGQEESGTIIKVRPRATLPDGEYVMYVGGEDVTTPYAFNYYVGAAKEPLAVEGIVTRVPKVAAAGGASVSYKITTALTAATDVTDVTVGGVSIKDKCTVAYDETLQAWKLTIADVGYTYGVGSYSAVVSATGMTSTAVQFTVYDVMNYADGEGNVLYTSEIVDNKATLKPGVAHNGAKVASIDKYFTAWNYNNEDFNLETHSNISVVDGERTATIKTATPKDGYTAGDIISKAGAQWVRYKAAGDSAEYDGIRFVSLVDFDAKVNGYDGVDYKNLANVTEEELSNLALTSGVGTINYVQKGSVGTPTFSVDKTNNVLTFSEVGGNYEIGSIYFRPTTVRTDAVKNVLTFKFKASLTDAEGNPTVTASSSAPAYIRFSSIGEKADGSEVSHRGTQYAFSATTAGGGAFSRGAGAGANGYAEGQFTLGQDGYYNVKIVSYEDEQGRQFAATYDMNADGAAKGYHRYDSTNTNAAATLGHGFVFQIYKAGSDGSKNVRYDFKDIEMSYEYDSMAEIDHVGVVVSNVAQAPTIEAGIVKTESKTVYDAIRVRQGDDVTLMDVAEIKATAETEEKKFSNTLDSIFYAIVKIPDARKDQRVYATPYVQFTDGTRVYGAAVTDAEGNLGVTYNGLKGSGSGETPDPLETLLPADEALTVMNWKASWTTGLGL